MKWVVLLVVVVFRGAIDPQILLPISTDNG